MDGIEIAVKAARLALQRGQRRLWGLIPLGGIETRPKDARVTEPQSPADVGPSRRVLAIKGHLYVRGTGLYTTPWSVDEYKARVQGTCVDTKEHGAAREWTDGSFVELSVRQGAEYKFAISRTGRLSLRL